MSKDKDIILFDDIEWGNKTLPGLSDEELMTTNWNIKKTQAEKDLVSKRFNDKQWKQQWLKKNTERLKDPVYHKKLSEGAKLFYKNNPDIAKQRANTPEAKANKKKAMKELMASGKWKMPSFEGHNHTAKARKKISEANAGIEMPKHARKKVAEYQKGRKKAKSTIEKIKKRAIGRETDRSRSVMTPLGEFAKLKLAAEAFGVHETTIRARCKNKNMPDYYYTNSINALGRKKVHTPEGIFVNIMEAAKQYKLQPEGMRHRLYSEHWPDFYYLEERSDFESPQITTKQ